MYFKTLPHVTITLVRALILLLQYQGEICGVLSYNDFQAHDASANIGYWLGAAYQGHGIISTALPVLLQHGFQQLGLQQVFILRRWAQQKRRHSQAPVLNGRNRSCGRSHQPTNGRPSGVCDAERKLVRLWGRDCPQHRRGLTRQFHNR